MDAYKALGCKGIARADFILTEDGEIILNKIGTAPGLRRNSVVPKLMEQYGMSINAYLTSLRITHAKQLLRFTDKTVEEIGLECGLGALHYFSRVFKEVEGVAPSVYRSQW